MLLRPILLLPPVLHLQEEPLRPLPWAIYPEIQLVEALLLQLLRLLLRFNLVRRERLRQHQRRLKEKGYVGYHISK